MFAHSVGDDGEHDDDDDDDEASQPSLLRIISAAPAPHTSS